MRLHGAHHFVPDTNRITVNRNDSISYPQTRGFGDAPGKPGRFPPYTFVAWALPGENAWRRGKLAEGAPESGESFLVGCLDPSVDSR